MFFVQFKAPKVINVLVTSHWALVWRGRFLQCQWWQWWGQTGALRLYPSLHHRSPFLLAEASCWGPCPAPCPAWRLAQKALLWPWLPLPWRWKGISNCLLLTDLPLSSNGLEKSKTRHCNKCQLSHVSFLLFNSPEHYFSYSEVIKCICHVFDF